jgi:hypothetical protein
MKAATTLAQVTALQLFSMFSALKLFNVEEEKLKGGHVRSSCLVRERKAGPPQVSNPDQKGPRVKTTLRAGSELVSRLRLRAAPHR